ncbi:hypothetical protein A0256_12055 [Mucilaginibacter sp. PAMC 26640]|nr:hypothetical protein A0256_12055 [Mucilaginibacter sp. PAMC 26640]
MAKIGLVTVLFKSDDVLKDFLESLSIQSFKDYHLYIIDNSVSAGTDSLLSVLLKQYPIPAYTHIKNEGNAGVAAANNQGMRLSMQQGDDFVLLLNNDIAFSQSFLLERLVGYAAERKEDMVIPKILYYGTRKIWLAGGEFIHWKGTSITIGDKEEDAEIYNREHYFDYAPTCFMLLSRKVIAAVGYMDEAYFVYYDDNDYVMRAIRKGFRIFYMPDIEVFHKVSFSTGGSESLFSIYYLNRNRIYFIRKFYKFPIRQIALGQMILSKFIRYVFYYNKDRKQQLARAVKEGFSITVPGK